MAFAWDIFAEQIGRTAERTAGAIRQKAAEKDRAEQLEARAMSLAKLKKKLDFDALKQELKFKSSWDGLQYSIGQDLSGMPPDMAKEVQLSVLMARSGYDVPPEKFSSLSELNQAKISDILFTNRKRNAEIGFQTDKIRNEAERIEAFREREKAYTRGELRKREAEEEKAIEKRSKKLHEKSKTLVKNALLRLNNEKAILVGKSKPTQYEVGALPARKVKFAKQLENVEEAIDFVNQSGSYIAGGLPLRQSQEIVIKSLTGNITKLRSGEILKDYRAKMQKRGREAMDDYGFFIGEEREHNGITYKYVGEDKWVPVK